MSSLSTALCAVLCLSLPALPQNPDEEAAQAELEKGEKLVGKGSYDRAQKLYGKLAEKYPDTPAGKLAATRSQTNEMIGWGDILRHGPSENRVDVVLMGDGFLLKKQDAFDDLARDIPRGFERDSVFGEYWSYFNFIKANLVSEEDGVDGYGRESSTALGSAIAEAGDFDSVTIDRFAVQAVLERIPDADGYALVFVPRGMRGTGGFGIGTVGGAKPNPITVMHEWGHAFAGLKDEYADYSGYRGEATSWINVSDTEDPEQVPWKHWLEAKVRGIGVYEGADGRVRDAWKPTASGCRMETGEFYCAVCREAIVLKIYEHVDPIENHTPPMDAEAGLMGHDPHTLSVQVLEPESHRLTVQWFVFPADLAPESGGDPTLRPRRKRGPLPDINKKPDDKTRGKKGLHRFKVSPKDLDAGRYRVVCRVVDTTEMRGEKHPWVLKDDHGVLASERSWWIEVTK